MTVAALLDLGIDEKLLTDTLKTLPLEGYEIRISRVRKAGLSACDFNVVLAPELENHDHDMAYLHGLLAADQATENSGKKPAGEHGHEDYLTRLAARNQEADEAAEPVTEDHHATHEDGGHDPMGHSHRGLKEVLEILRASKLSERALETAERIFTILGEAEAKAHGETLETVHFHEVGAVDSIVDIAAAAICLDLLDVTEVIITGLCEGTGTIRCAHGILPVPVPAVSHIVTHYRIPLTITKTEGELVTPTGAAIAAAIRTREDLPERMTINRIGLGAGKRSYERPSLLRAMLIEEAQGAGTLPKENGPERIGESVDCVVKLETDVDDCTGEAMGFLLNELMAAGAREAHYAPVYMKKNRPGYELTVICTEETRPALEELIFLHTTSIGIRRTPMERTVLPRSFRTVMTPYGDVKVKEVVLPNGEKRYYPEYEDIAIICRAHGLGYMQVYSELSNYI